MDKISNALTIIYTKKTQFIRKGEGGVSEVLHSIHTLRTFRNKPEMDCVLNLGVLHHKPGFLSLSFKGLYIASISNLGQYQFSILYPFASHGNIKAPVSNLKLPRP